MWLDKWNKSGFLKKIRQPGRVFTLQAFLFLLICATGVYLAINIHKVKLDFQNAGSLEHLWEVEWRSGKTFTEMFTSGAFQVFILVLGWSSYFRLRMRQFTHIRLRRSEHKYRTIINHAGEAIFLLDSQGVILEWNKAAELLLNTPRRTALNQRLDDLELGLDLDVGRVLEGVRKTQRSYSYEMPFDYSEHVQKILDLTISAIQPGAGFMAEKNESLVVIARDITSQKQLENRMGQAEKLAGIGQLAAGIAHQLNTPLGSILLSAQMVEEDVEDEDVAEDIRRIIRQTEQCRGIIKGLLNFARPTGSGRGRTNLAELIDDTSYLLEKNLKLANVEFQLVENVPSWVHGNRNELEQVFFNLLANSLDAMETGGQVKVTIEKGDPGELLVIFQDTGDGISKDQQDQIFLPFYTTKDYGKGTGLGLSIVARIVHEHGGRIEVQSELGKGTTFRLSFPGARPDSGSSALIEDSM